MAQLMKRLIGCRDMGTWIIIVALGCGLVAAIREALTARALDQSETYIRTMDRDVED